jgi:hypothetical protein
MCRAAQDCEICLSNATVLGPLKPRASARRERVSGLNRPSAPQLTGGVGAGKIPALDKTMLAEQESRVSTANSTGLAYVLGRM